MVFNPVMWRVHSAEMVTRGMIMCQNKPIHTNPAARTTVRAATVEKETTPWDQLEVRFNTTFLS